MREAVSHIAQEIGERFGGSDAEHRTTDYLAARFKACHLPTDVQRFKFIGWQIDRWPTLKILSPIQTSLEAAPLLYSDSTPTEGVSGFLIHRGNTALVPGVMDMPIYDIVSENQERLASVIVELDGPAIPLLNPRPMLQLPQVVIGIQDKEQIDCLLAKGPVKVELDIQAHVEPEATAANVICHAKNPDAEKRLVISAHMDTTLNTPGAYDNASGLGALVELAQAVQLVDTDLGIDLVAFACEEVGFHGSAYYVNDLLEHDLLNQVLACINLDMISGGDELWVWAGPDDFRRKLDSLLSKTKVAEQFPIRIGPQRAGGDDWNFHLYGIPGTTMLFWRQDVYHKPTDTLDRVDWSRISTMVDVILAIIRGF